MPNRIKKLREENAMTQVRLSIELEVTQETVSAYEIGKHYPSVKSLLKMADLFDASMDYILGLSEIRKAASDEIISQDEVRMITLYRKMDKIQKEKVYAFMQGQLSIKILNLFLTGTSGGNYFLYIKMTRLIKKDRLFALCKIRWGCSKTKNLLQPHLVMFIQAGSV